MTTLDTEGPTVASVGAAAAAAAAAAPAHPDPHTVLGLVDRNLADPERFERLMVLVRHVVRYVLAAVALVVLPVTVLVVTLLVRPVGAALGELYGVPVAPALAAVTAAGVTVLAWVRLQRITPSTASPDAPTDPTPGVGTAA